MLLARGIVVASTIGAALAVNHLGGAYHHHYIYWIALAGFVLLAAAGSRLRGLALPMLLAGAYVSPAIYIALVGGGGFSVDIVWILPLLGLCLSGSGAQRWSLPGPWQWPLITWSLLVAVAWPIVFLREVDFAPWILPLERVSNTSIGISPWDTGLNISYFALGHNAGILFVDALCRWYEQHRERFRTEVLTTLLIATTLSIAVAFYQAFVDLGFLNQRFWTYMIRASGMIGDPNKLGTVAGFWTVGAMAYARALPASQGAAVSLAALALGGGAAWVSGSRTGLAAVAISLAIAAFEIAREFWSRRASTRIDVKRAGLFGGIAVLLLAGMVGMMQSSSTHTIVQRGTLGYLPFFGDRGIAESANELLWDRFGYGPAAIQMIKEYPIEGVGVGMYHTLSYDFGEVVGRVIPQPDNAQAWWRHNLAEFGVLGFVPLLWWCVVFGRALFSPNRSGDRALMGMLRAVLIAYFVASMFGLSSQSVAITLTFWIFVFWFWSEKYPAGEIVRPAPLRSNMLLAAAALVVIHGAMTTIDAFGELRPRHRAQRFDWYYRYGYVHPDDVEPDPGGGKVGRRWTMEKSLAVVEVKGRTLKFAAWADHPDANERPVHVRVWAESALLYEGSLRRAQPVFLDIPAPAGKRYITIETEIDRLFRPADYGSRDRRTLGLSVRDWVWE